MSYYHDMGRYKGNFKGLFFIICFRIAHFFTINKLLFVLGCPIWLLYRLVFNYLLGIDISEKTSIGKGFVIWHGMGLVVNPTTIIGNNVTLRHNTTIGSAYKDGPSPVIEDDVDIGGNCVILGGVTIGCGAIVGAGAVVVKDVPSGIVVVGNPAHEISKKAK